MTMSWAVALSFIVVMARFRRMVLGVVVSPVLVLVLVIASLLPKEASKQLMPALQSYWFYIHVTLAALRGGRVHRGGGGGHHLPDPAQRTGEKDFLPSRDLLEEIISRSLRIGYPLFTIGALFAGAIWAQYAWGSFWSWDPKETGSLVLWLYYTLLLHQNVRGALAREDARRHVDRGARDRHRVVPRESLLRRHARLRLTRRAGITEGATIFVVSIGSCPALPTAK